MILIMNDHDVGTIKYIGYLSDSNIPFIGITLSDLVNKTKIIATISNDKRETIWTIDKKHFSLNDVTGIYNNYSYPEKSIFCNFQTEDVDYAREEWHAYLSFELASHVNCINPVSHISFTGTFLCLPNLYKIAKSLSLNVPDYFLLNGDKQRANKLMKSNYIIKESLYDYVNYSQKLSMNVVSETNPVLAIKIGQGVGLICFIFGNQIYSIIKYRDSIEVFYLDEMVKKKILELAQKLNLRIAELFFMITKMELIFYHINKKINFVLAKKYFPNIFDDLTLLLQQSS